MYAKGKACKHQDAKPTGGPGLTLVKNIDKYATPEVERSIHAKEGMFRKKLKAYGLEQIRVDALVLRFVYDLPLSVIASELGIPNRQTAFNIIKKAQELLKERGFKL